MRRNRRATLQVEALEGKALLSAPPLPVLTHHTFDQVLRQIDQSAGAFAKTRNTNGFIAGLSQISFEIPFGHRALFPVWQTDVGIFKPNVPGSGLAMVKQLKADLASYVKAGVAAGAFLFR
jgi:hypothetical protein